MKTIHAVDDRIRRATRAALLCPAIALAWAGHASAQNTSAAFLKIPVNARELGLGEGIVAMGDDVGSVAHNPAGLAHLQSKELSMLYAPHIAGMNLGFLAYGQPTSLGNLGVSYMTLQSGAMDGRDDGGNPTSSFNAQDQAVGLSYGSAFLRDADHPAGLFRLGTNVKYISSRIATYQASGLALDLGGQAPVPLGYPLSLGFAVRNVGPGLHYLDQSDPLPLTAVAGVALQPMAGMALTAGVQRLIHEQKTEFSLGTEYAPVSMLALRGRYSLSQLGSAAGGGSQSGISGGIGLKLSNYRFDYAFVPMGDLGSTQRISLTTHFGSPSAAAVRSPSPKALEMREQEPADVLDYRRSDQTDDKSNIPWVQ